MGLARERLATVRTAAAIHDVGKLHLPQEIVRKPARLTDDEFAVIQRHAEGGARMVACLGYDRVASMSTERPTQVPSPPRGADASLSILVVDDESDLREMLTRSFSREGHRVMAVADGRAAIDRASTDQFDIVLLDVALGAGPDGSLPHGTFTVLIHTAPAQTYVNNNGQIVTTSSSAP